MPKKKDASEKPEVEIVDDQNPSPDEKLIVVADTMLPGLLPLVPIRERPMFPKMMQPIALPNEDLKQIIPKDQNNRPAFFGLVLLNEEVQVADNKDVRPGMLHKIGTAVKILQKMTPDEGPFSQIVVHGLERFEIVEFKTQTPPFLSSVKYLYEIKVEVDDDLKAYAVALINTMKELVNLKPVFGEQLNLLLSKINVYQPGSLADLAASLTTASPYELQKILETRDIRSRIEQSLILMKKELEISKLQTKINKRIEERLSTQQREFFLKQQLKEIKEELGLTKDDKETEVDKYKKRLEKLTLTDEAQERVDEEMEKLSVLEPASAEFNVTRTYLDWLTILPWGVYTEDNAG